MDAEGLLKMCMEDMAVEGAESLYEQAMREVECQSKNSCNEVASILVSDGKTQMLACDSCCEIQTIEKEDE